MSYCQSLMHNSSRFILCTVAAFTITITTSAAAQFPNCNKIAQWGASAYELDKNIRQGNFFGGKYNGKYLMSGFMDELFKPTFGTTFDSWGAAEYKLFKPHAKKCQESAGQAAKAASKKRNGKAVKFYNAAAGFIGMIGVRTPENRVDSYMNMLSHQKTVYGEHKKARILKDTQQATAKAMQANQENIKKLAVMAREPQFVYLRPQVKRNHEITLHNRGVELADKMVDEAAAKFNDFPTSLKGLQDIQAFRLKLQKDLQGLKSSRWSAFDTAYMARTIAIAGHAVDDAISGLDDFSDGLEGLKKLTAFRQEIQTSLGQVRTARWPDFEKAYATALNDAAASAVEDFEEELAELPATNMSLQQVRASVGNLFKYRPAPANLQAYRDIATERARMMEQDIRKVACYKGLESTDLDEDARETAILGSNGETTLGLFICAMNKRGYKFQDYEEAGWFGSTYTLSILNRRGITLTIELEEVEAVKDREMLVGVNIIDASSETKLTLTGWQDYASRLTGARSF